MPTINTNVAAIKARRNLDKVQRELDTSIARLSSGKRITRAHDDASGMAIAGRMESQIRGLTMNIKNAKDGQSLVDTQEGALQQVTALLQRMRELGVQAASGSVNQNTADKDSLQTENLALIHEILAIGANTKFNDKTILQGESFSFYTDIDVAGTAITTVTAALYTSTLNIATATVSIGGTEAVAEIKKTINQETLTPINTESKKPRNQ